MQRLPAQRGGDKCKQRHRNNHNNQNNDALLVCSFCFLRVMHKLRRWFAARVMLGESLAPGLSVCLFSQGAGSRCRQTERPASLLPSQDKDSRYVFRAALSLAAALVPLSPHLRSNLDCAWLLNFAVHDWLGELDIPAAPVPTTLLLQVLTSLSTSRLSGRR